MIVEEKSAKPGFGASSAGTAFLRFLPGPLHGFRDFWVNGDIPSMQPLSQQFSQRTVTKVYNALLSEHRCDNVGEIDAVNRLCSRWCRLAESTASSLLLPAH